jgi:hypothetical protein
VERRLKDMAVELEEQADKLVAESKATSAKR